MPYIPQEDRVRLNEKSIIPNNVGELNYMITDLISHYFEAHGSRYQQINDVIGALEGAKLEFYRRVAVPYEESKIEENGDVY